MRKHRHLLYLGHFQSFSAPSSACWGDAVTSGGEAVLTLDRRGRYKDMPLAGPGRRKWVGVKCALCGRFRNKTSICFPQECP